MKIIVKAKDVEIQINDEVSKEYNGYEYHVDNLIKVINLMTEEACKLIRELNPQLK